MHTGSRKSKVSHTYLLGSLRYREKHIQGHKRNKITKGGFPAEAILVLSGPHACVREAHHLVGSGGMFPLKLLNFRFKLSEMASDAIFKGPPMANQKELQGGTQGGLRSSNEPPFFAVRYVAV